MPASDPVAAGDALLAEGKYQEALDAYLAVTRADSRNVAAQMGAGIAYNALAQPVSAVKAFERAYLLDPRNRAVAHNTALILFRTDVQPRALKVMKDYLAAAREPDEVMFESLRYMLEHASDETKKTRLYTEVETFASQYARSFDRKRPGFVKWGVGWITAKQAADNAVLNKRFEAEAEVIADRIALLDRDIKNLNRRTPEIESMVRRGFDPRSVLDQHLETIRNLSEQRADAARERLAVLDRRARPAAAAEPTWIAFGTPTPELPSIEMLAAQTAPPPPPTTVPAEEEPVGPGNEPPVANNPPVPPVNAPPVRPGDLAKRVTRYGVAFAISQDTLVTSSDLVSGALDITVQSQQGTTDEGKVVKDDPKTGLCLVRITKLKAAALRMAGGFHGGAVQCIGIPSVDLFHPSTSTINGTCREPEAPWTVALQKSPRLPGAPLLSNGSVVGVTLANRDTEPDAVPAVTLKQLTEFVGNDFGTAGAFTNEPKAAVFQIVATHESK